MSHSEGIQVFETTRGILKRYENSMKSVLPKDITVDRIKGIVFEAVRSKPKDMTRIFTTPPGQASFVSAVIRSAKVGLAPDGVVAAIVPRRINNIWMANFEPMWRGLAVLAYNSGQVRCIRGDYVYTKDYWEHEDGLLVKMIHRKCRENNRGELLCAWAVVETIHGGMIPKVVYQFDVDRALQGVKKSDNPRAAHNQWAAEMWRKTAYKQALATAPMSDELRLAIVSDDQGVAAELAGDQRMIIDIDPVEVQSEDLPDEDGGGMSDEELRMGMSAEAGQREQQKTEETPPPRETNQRPPETETRPPAQETPPPQREEGGRRKSADF